MASTAPEGKRGAPVAVIAGGAGFLGSHLAEVLLAQGYKVICLDNYVTGKEAHLKHLLGHSQFVFKTGDINQGLPKLSRVDCIWHLAGVEEYINGTDVSVETLLVNSIGTRNLLEMAKEHQAKLLLASSVDLYSGILSSLSLDNYFGISRRDEERFSHHEAKRYAEALTTEYFKKFGVDARIARLADVYGPRMDLRSGTEMSELLAESLQPDVKYLTIHGDGLKVLHPTYVTDVVYGLVKAVGEGTSGKIFNLVSSEAQTVLNFASRLRKVVPTHPELKFVSEISETRFPARNFDLEASHKDLGWRAVVGLEDGLKRTWAYFKAQKEVPAVPHLTVGTSVLANLAKTPEYSTRLQPFSVATRLKNLLNFLFRAPRGKPPPTIKKARKLRIKVALATAVVFIAVSILVPLSGVLFHSGYGAWRLGGSQSALTAGQADSAFAAAASAEDSFSAGASDLEDLTWLLSLLQLRETAENYRHLITAAKEVSSAVKNLSMSLKPLIALGQDLVQTDVTAKVSAEYTNKELSEVRGILEVADDRLAAAEGEIKKVNPANLPGFARGQFDEVQEKLSEARASISRARVGTKLLPEIIGLNGARNYLLLFLNNTEIRPGGGFIGSYGVARFEDGRLRDLFVDDVYNPDGQLKEHITPPAPIRDYLGVGSLGLRDSNWSPDFPTSSKLARELLFKSTKRSVDGVIALDIKGVENLLRVLGPVTLADYGETITADNFFERAQFHADVNFFPGSTAKKDFMGAAARIVLDKFLRSKPEIWPGIILSLQKSLSEKHLLLNSNNADVQALLAESNWDGAIAQVSNVSEIRSGRVEDYLMVVDANVGANKANYFVRPQGNYRVVVDKNGGLSAQLTLLYEHTATTETWPSGRYKNFLRVYVPKGAVLQKLELSDSRETPSFTTTQENDKTVFGFFFEVPSQTKKTVILNYALPMKLPTIARESTYHLLIQKQAGQAEPQFSVNFDAPTFLKLSPTGGVNTAAYSARFTTDLSRDREFSLTVAP